MSAMDVDDDSSVTGEGSVSPSVLTGPFVGRQVFLKKPAKPAVVPAKEPARTLPPTAAEAIAVFTSHRKEVEECVESETEAVVLPTLAVEPSSTGPDRGCADDSKVDEDNAKNTGDEPETADRSVKEEAEEPDEVPAADVLPKKTPAKAPPKPKAPVDPNAPKYARSSYHFFLIELKMKDNGVKEKGGPKRTELWKAVSKEERKSYTEMAEHDKERYATELARYKLKQCLQKLLSS